MRFNSMFFIMSFDVGDRISKKDNRLKKRVIIGRSFKRLQFDEINILAGQINREVKLNKVSDRVF